MDHRQINSFFQLEKAILFGLLLIIGFFSCQKEQSYNNTSQETTIAYDIFPVLGQSNAYNGYGLNYSIDFSNSSIKQLGRFGVNNYKIIQAKDPMEHLTIEDSCNSFASNFALNYFLNYSERGREVLLIPCAENGSSFLTNRWNKGDTLYNDVVERVNYILKKYPGSKLRAFLWHQGETDVFWGRFYVDKLDNMIRSMRNDIVNADSIPFILGGFVPYWTDKKTERKIVDSVIWETSKRLPMIGYASAREPFVITKIDNTVDEIHFDAAGQRELGKRYFEAYKKLRK